MASGIWQTNANAILNAQFQNSAFTGPVTVYANLRTTTPSDTATGTLAGYTSYAAQALTCNSTNWPNAAAGAITYGPAITYPTSTGGSETEAWVTIDTAAAGLTTLYWGALSSGVLIASGNQPAFGTNAITVSAV
jgi:hypothetical protein